MGAVDSHACSNFPVFVVLTLVLLLAGGGVLLGKRLVRMSTLGWLSLVIGGLFLCRCLHSYSQVDAWGEAALILGGIVYYVAGVYVAQNRHFRSLFFVLSAAVLLNIAAYVAARQPEFCLAWTGRAAVTPEGVNNCPVSLFVYKNFAGVFFCVAGCVLGAWSLMMQRGWVRAVNMLLALLSVAVAFMCGTRAVFLVLPLCIFGFWFECLLIRLFQNRPIQVVDFLVGLALVVLAGVTVFELLFGQKFASLVNSVDSHLRFLIWSAVCEILHTVPFWGCGANATVWEIVPFYNEWQLPNYAHNEYLQLWVDYGVLGLGAAVIVLSLHVLQGLRCMASELVSDERRMLASLALVVLLSVGVYAAVDFPWHSFAFVSMCAFACGVLASPFARICQSLFSSRRWASGSSAPKVAVRAQSWPGRLVLLAGLVALAFVAIRLSSRLLPAWQMQWQYAEIAQSGADEKGAARRALIAELMPQYPSAAAMDTYFMLPPYDADWMERERLLKMALKANPKQLFMVTMLADVLGKQGKFAEAEQLMRESYVGSDMPGSLLNNWPAYYAYNLLIWGRSEMQKGEHAKALSLLNHASGMMSKYSMNFNPVYRRGEQPWNRHGGIKPELPALRKSAETDLRLLRLIGVAPDDSWKLPLTSGGKPALYQSCQPPRQK